MRLSADGHSIAAIMAVLQVSRPTVYTWFNRWQTGGLARTAATQIRGRHVAPGVGKIPIGQNVAAFFNKCGGTWRRFRHALKEAQNPDDYADKAERLAWVQELEKEGHVDVFYGDESGFCLTSAIPYGWQFPGEHVATQPRHSPRFNVLGFYNAATNELHTAPARGRWTRPSSSTRLRRGRPPAPDPRCWCSTTPAMRRAAAFQARLGAWQAQDVYLFYLPTYRPRLNKIETLWRKIKYEWLRPQAYATFQTLKTAV